MYYVGSYISQNKLIKGKILTLTKCLIFLINNIGKLFQEKDTTQLLYGACTCCQWIGNYLPFGAGQTAFHSQDHTWPLSMTYLT